MSRRKMPAPQGNRHSPKHRANGYTHPNRVDPLDVEDRTDRAVLDAAAARGYHLVTWCEVCGRPLTARKSLLAHIGPICRSKSVIM